MKDDTTPVGEEGKLVVSKLVTFQGKNQAVNRTFYVALFSDADCTQKVSNVKELKCEGAWSAYTVFEHLKDGTYYVAETDKDGNPVENTDFGFDVSYDGDITVSFTEQNTDSTLAITNDMTERNPEYKKYSKKISYFASFFKIIAQNKKNVLQKTAALYLFNYLILRVRIYFEKRLS